MVTTAPNRVHPYVRDPLAGDSDPRPLPEPVFSRERVWCPECRSRQPIVDQFTDSQHTRWGEEEYGVTILGCDHSVVGPPRIVGPSPGAPYAGNVVTSPTTRTRDLLAAARRDPFLNGDPE